MKILIDNGHGQETKGKCSPDGTHREWAWSRKFARRLRDELTARGYDARLLVPEDSDVSLRERVRRANSYAPGDAVVISIHNNAAGHGSGWHGARGFCALVAPGASAVSRRLAAALTRAAARRGLTGNRALPPDGYLTASLAICRDTRCPAVLTENLFMDNAEDVALLRSEAGVRSLLDVHLEAIAEL